MPGLLPIRRSSIVGCPEYSFPEYSARLSTSLVLLVHFRRLINTLMIGLAGSVSIHANAAGETLELRNTSPVAQLFGIPAMRGARAENLSLRFTVDSANSFTGDVNADEFVFLDGEISTFSYTVKHGFGNRWEAGLELPWVVHSGGRFDGLIDEFHDILGLPDGGRPVLQGTLGLQFELTWKAKIELALIEDLSGAAAADAIFKLSIVGQL